MKTIPPSRKNIRKIYKQLHAIYYLNSVLNKILIEQYDFSHLEIATLSRVTNRRLENLKGQVVDMIPTR